MSEILSHPIPSVVLLLGVLVLVHELGHYLVGVLFKVGVETFSIGFGPKMFGFRKGDTDFRISWIPLGGYVKFAGAIASEEVPERFIGKEMFNTAVWKRFLIVAAGPLANFILAVVVFAILGAAGIKHASPIVGQVRLDGPAGKTGIRSGDKIVELNGQPIVKWDEIQSIIGKSIDEKVKIVVDRKGEKFEFVVQPETITAKDFLDKDVKQGRIGIGYGFTPPIVSLIDANKPFAISGIKTGDKITSIAFKSETREVKSWPEVQEVLYDVFLFSQSGDKFTIALERAGQKSNIEVVLQERFDPHTIAHEKSNYLEAYKAIQDNLGIADSQLTLETVQKEVEDVLKVNDRITTFDDIRVKDVYHLQDLLTQNKKPKVAMQVFRDLVVIDLQISLKPIEVQKAAGAETLYMLPVSFMGASVQPEPYLEKYDNVLSALVYGSNQTFVVTGKLFAGIVDLFTGNLPIKSIGGPMMIAKFAGDSAKLGWQAFLTTMALISINLGIVNLLPIPALDGGHIVMLIAEAIKRRAVSDEAMENYQKIGFVMVVALMILATYNDLSRFWKTMLAGIAGVF